MRIRRYTAADAPGLFELLRSEGDEWSDYNNGFEKYKTALDNSIVYLLFENNFLCGYIRLRDDDGFGLYVYDLLVHKNYRGKGYGKLLLEQIRVDYPDNDIYAMSDVDKYYEKQGYNRIGSIFIINERN